MQTQSFEDIIKIQPKWLITIPKKARQGMGFEENGLARIKKDRGILTIEPVRTLPYPVRTYTKEELEEFIRFDEEQGRELRRLKLIK